MKDRSSVHSSERSSCPSERSSEYSSVGSSSTSFSTSSSEFSSADTSTGLSAGSHVFVWFGAAISLAEILTGTFLAPLGFEQGVLAILIGHLIGGVLFWLAAYLSAKERKPAMEAAKLAFGTRGVSLFSLANVAQLVGWTAIMIMSGAVAANFLWPQFGYMGWCFAIGILIVLWVAVGPKGSSILQTVACLFLLGLCLVLSFVVFGEAFGAAFGTSLGTPLGTFPGEPAATASEGISFAAAVELSVAMPLSWLPVVGDYTMRAKRPFSATTLATASYFVGSFWMFALGLGAVCFLGISDVAEIVHVAGMGVFGILVVIFSTTTTTYLDAASAGTSLQSVFARVNAKYFGIAAAVLGALAAAALPVTSLEPFLYLIGSVFAPMAAILFVNYYLLRTDASADKANWLNLVLWLLGFALYRVSMGWDFILGNTLPVMLVVAALCFVAHKVRKRLERRRTRAG